MLRSQNSTSVLLVLVVMLGVATACIGKYGWGEKEPLLPKLKQQFVEGKAGVNVYKIVEPSLKPNPYHKKYGFIGKGWLPADFHPKKKTVVVPRYAYGYPHGVARADLIGIKGTPDIRVHHGPDPLAFGVL